jgi:hypothetical protein
MNPKLSPDSRLAEEISAFYADPLGFVRFAFPWGEPGQLEQSTGPDTWQTAVLEEIGAEVRKRKFDGFTAVEPIREAIASGHGIGKSALVAWLVCWIMSTRPHCQGTITANTFVQLESKTWAQIQKWSKLCITSHWFRLTGTRMSNVDYPATWFCSAQTCKEENSEAFAGQHAKTSTSFYIFDEASAIPDKIFEVAEGGLTDGEPMVYLFGNPTKNTGKLHRVCFGSERPRWRHRSIDSRDSAITNKAQIAEWVADYGEDSDFVRVRVRGIPPRASELQFIPADLVEGAQNRVAQPLSDDPLIAGVDVSGGGAAWNVVRFRRGVDARSIPPIRIPGEHGRDRAVMIAKLSEVLAVQKPELKVDMMFVDSAFGSPIVERLQTLGFRNVVEVNFGGKSANPHQLNMRAFMWNALKDWLTRGCIDKNDIKLEVDLIGPGFHLNRTNQLVLESKQEMQKRGVPSPDDADALCLTFAQPVAPIRTDDLGSGDYSPGWMA